MATSSDKSRVGRPSGTSATAEKACFCCCWNCCGCEAADSTTLLFVVVDAVGVLFSHVRNGKTLETKFLNPPPNALVSFIFFSSFFAANFSVLASMFAIHLDAQFFLYSSSSSRFFSSSSNLAFSSAAALSSASFFAFALASFFALIAAFLASSSASAFASPSP
jgi:hypothetical protein